MANNRCQLSRFGRSLYTWNRDRIHIKRVIVKTNNEIFNYKSEINSVFQIVNFIFPVELKKSSTCVYSCYLCLMKSVYIFVSYS